MGILMGILYEVTGSIGWGVDEIYISAVLV
jgi:hypothetical protein